MRALFLTYRWLPSYPFLSWQGGRQRWKTERLRETEWEHVNAQPLWSLLVRTLPDAGKNWGHEEKGGTEDEMVGCYHRLNGHVWANSRRQWRIGKPGVLQSMRVAKSWTWLSNWTTKSHHEDPDLECPCPPAAWSRVSVPGQRLKSGCDAESAKSWPLNHKDQWPMTWPWPVGFVEMNFHIDTESSEVSVC